MRNNQPNFSLEKTEDIAFLNLTQNNKNNIFTTSIGNNVVKNNLVCTNNSANIRRTKKRIKSKVINKKNPIKNLPNYSVIHNNSTNNNIVVKKNAMQLKESSPIKIIENTNHNSLLNDYIYNNLYQKLKKKSPQRKLFQRKNLINKSLNNKKTVLPKIKNNNLLKNQINLTQKPKNEKAEYDSNNENIASFYLNTNYITNDSSNNNNYISTLSNVSNNINDYKLISERSIPQNEKNNLEKINYRNKIQKPISKKNNNIKINVQKKFSYKLKNNFNKNTLSVSKKSKEKKLNNIIPKSRNIDLTIFNKNDSCPVFKNNKSKYKSRNIQRGSNSIFKTNNDTKNTESHKEHKNTSVIKKNINIIKNFNNTDNNKSKIKPKIKIFNRRGEKSENKSKKLNNSGLFKNRNMCIKVD